MIIIITHLKLCLNWIKMSKYFGNLGLNAANLICLIIGIPFILLTALFYGHNLIIIVALAIGFLCGNDLAKSAHKEGTNAQWAFFIGMWFSLVGWFFYSV